MRKEEFYFCPEIGRVIVKSSRIGDGIALDVQLRVITFVTICRICKIKFPALSLGKHGTSDLCVLARCEVAMLINIFRDSRAITIMTRLRVRSTIFKLIGETFLDIISGISFPKYTRNLENLDSGSSLIAIPVVR